jgi:hypothetical protein
VRAALGAGPCGRRFVVLSKQQPPVALEQTMPQTPEGTTAPTIRSSPLGCSRFLLLPALYLLGGLAFVITRPPLRLMQGYGWHPGDAVARFINLVSLINFTFMPIVQPIGSIGLFGLALWILFSRSRRTVILCSISFVVLVAFLANATVEYYDRCPACLQLP